LQVTLGKDAAADNVDSDWLFIRHTYITSLIATIIQQQLLGDVSRHAYERPDDLLKGRILAEQSDLHGIIDADLFTWPTEIGESAYLVETARQVERFNWADQPREVAPTLYQNVITQEERKRLGEYYTPRWLAQEITETVVDDPLNQRVIDASCGSGTFIETAVERILEEASGLSPTETLRVLQENVAGIEVNTLCVGASCDDRQILCTVTYPMLFTGDFFTRWSHTYRSGDEDCRKSGGVSAKKIFSNRGKDFMEKVAKRTGGTFFGHLR